MSPSRTAKSDITPRALREAESARYIGMSRAYLRAARLGRCDGPTYIRAGRAVRYLIPDLDAWLQRKRVAS